MEVGKDIEFFFFLESENDDVDDYNTIYTHGHNLRKHSIGNYNFGYNVHHRDGQQQFRQESRDILGRVVGSYGLAEPDGRQRVVDYVADHNGFRARVRSNEPGLQGIDSAGVRIVKPEDVPPPLLLPMDHRVGQGSEVLRVPYNPGGPPMENPSRWGETDRAFLPLTPDKPYITQSEGLYIPPQAVDDLVYSPSGINKGGFGSFQKTPLGFPRSAKLESNSDETSTEEHRYDSVISKAARIEYPSSVFSLPNSEERYGAGKSTRRHSFRYRVVQIPNGIQAIPELDPTGSGAPFPSANDIFSDLARYYPTGGDTFGTVDVQSPDYSRGEEASTREQQRQGNRHGYNPPHNPDNREYTNTFSTIDQQRRQNERPYNEGFSPVDQQQRQDLPYAGRPYQREYQRPEPRGDSLETVRPEDYAEYGRRISQSRSV
ncbi:hypothetical protein LAZ67_5000001 [Cordylochernes scorpioides]|uniref:Uncharacterized protein n=1 Tax=Cordylochernes scorpioides TaxID=51811 RepID=A0ABY6KHI4_9ARAC|nr:hypothetical protein LAZ67_5000001 [Cordylochernes scorpioides]